MSQRHRKGFERSLTPLYPAQFRSISPFIGLCKERGEPFNCLRSALRRITRDKFIIKYDSNIAYTTTVTVRWIDAMQKYRRLSNMQDNGYHFMPLLELP